MHQPIGLTAWRVPPLIKRNTVLFALSQSFTGAGMSMAFLVNTLWCS